MDLPSSCHTALTHFRKINWVPTSVKVESCVATTVFKNWNGTVPSYINDISHPSLNRHNTGSQMTLDIPLRKTNTGQQALFVLNIWIKNSQSTKNVKNITSVLGVPCAIFC